MKAEVQFRVGQAILFLVVILIGAGCMPNITGQTPPTPTPIPVLTFTAAPVPTPQPETTVTVEPEPLEAGLLYQDDFTDITSGWPNGLEFDNYFIGYHEPDYYHVQVGAPNDSALVVLPGQSFDNITAEAELFVDPANTATEGDFRYGLALRRSGNQYYAFTISPRSMLWYIVKYGPGRSTVLSAGNVETLQGLTGPDRLRVDADGPNLTFYINGQQVGQVSDASYASGEAGFYVETFDSPRVHIHYDTLAIWNRPAPGASQSDTIPSQN